MRFETSRSPRRQLLRTPQLASRAPAALAFQSIGGSRRRSVAGDGERCMHSSTVPRSRSTWRSSARPPPDDLLPMPLLQTTCSSRPLVIVRWRARRTRMPNESVEPLRQCLPPERAPSASWSALLRESDPWRMRSGYACARCWSTPATASPGAPPTSADVTSLLVRHRGGARPMPTAWGAQRTAQHLTAQ